MGGLSVQQSDLGRPAKIAAGTVARQSDVNRQRIRAAWLFLTPMLAALVIVAAWPLLESIYFSFTNATLDTLDTAQWVGFKNYFNVIHLKSGKTYYSGLLADPGWWNAVWNTIRFAIVTVILETVFGVVVALVLNAEFRGRGIVRAAILVPWAIPTIVSAKMWAWLLNDQFGIINDILMRLHLISQPVAWTASPDTAFAAIVMVDVWKTTPFMSLLILAGLQMIPHDIFEAAKIDGIHPVKVFWRVTLPLVWPALTVAVIFRMMDALRIFDLIYVLSNNEQTKSMSIFSQENLFSFNKFAYGSAASTFLFLMLAVITIAYINLSRLDLEGGR